MKIIFLGTGGSVPTASRDNTSLLLDFNHSLILVDCPGSVSARLEKVGYQADQVSEIFITHLHPDHVYGLPALIHVLREREKALRLFGSEQTIDFCLKLLQLYCLDREKIWSHLHLVKIAPEQSVTLNAGLKFAAYQVRHHPSSLAFLFDDGERRIFVSGDTALEPELLFQVLPLSVLVHDCCFPSGVADSFPGLKNKHTNSLELGRVAAKLQPGLLLPCHFMSELRISLEEIEKEIRESFDGRLVIPQDFQVVDIG